MRIVHITSVHSTDDVRIFYKECVSLAAMGFDVTIAGPGSDTGIKDGVKIVGVGTNNRGRKGRPLIWKRLYRWLKQTDFDVLHIHDPELLPLAVLFCRSRRCVYDAHELLPESIQVKPYIPAIIRSPLSVMADIAELFFAKRLYGVVTADYCQVPRFLVNGLKVATVRNLPRSDLFREPVRRDSMKPNVIHIGGHTLVRGLHVMMEAARISPHVKFTMVGKVMPLEKIPMNVNFVGHIPHPETIKYLQDASIGIIALLPTPQYSVLQVGATKIFEYMAASLPIVASDLPAHRRLIGQYGCGLLYSPTDEQGLASQIQWLLAHPHEALEMGRRGRRAFEEEFHFEKEAEKLLALYSPFPICRQP